MSNRTGGESDFARTLMPLGRTWYTIGACSPKSGGSLYATQGEAMVDRESNSSSPQPGTRTSHREHLRRRPSRPPLHRTGQPPGSPSSPCSISDGRRSSSRPETARRESPRNPEKTLDCCSSPTERRKKRRGGLPGKECPGSCSAQAPYPLGRRAEAAAAGEKGRTFVDRVEYRGENTGWNPNTPNPQAPALQRGFRF